MAIQGWAKALRHQMKGWQTDLAPRTPRGGRATARQAQAQLSRRRSGRQQGRAEERGGRGGRTWRLPPTEASSGSSNAVSAPLL